MFKALIEPFRHPKPNFELGVGRSLGTASGGKPKAKAKDWSGTLIRIWSYLAESKAKLILVLIMVVFSSALALMYHT